MNRRASNLIETLEGRTLYSSVGGGHVDWDGMKHLTVKGRNGPDDIEITCHDVVDTHNEFHRAWYVEINGQTKGYDTPFIYNIDIDGGGGNDKIVINKLPDGQHVNVTTAGHGNTSSLFHVQQILSDKITYTGSGRDTLEFENNGERSYNKIDLTDSAVTLNGTDRVTFSGVNQVNYTGTYTDETIRVNRIGAGELFHVSGEQWNDTIIVGNGDIAKNIRGRLELDGGNEYNNAGADDDTLILDDSQSPGGRFATFATHKFTQTSLPKAITWSSFDHVAYTGSKTDDAVNVDAQAADHSLYVDTRGGNDIVRVGGNDATADLGHIGKAALSINGGSGYDTITLNDRRSPGKHGYTLAGKSFQSTQTAKWTIAGVEGETLFGGYGDSYVNAFVSGVRVNIVTQNGSDTVLGSAFDDSIDTGGGDDLIFGNAGNDTLTGGLGRDTVYGGAGEDLLRLNDGMADRYDGGDGEDAFEKDGFDKHTD